MNTLDAPLFAPAAFGLGPAEPLPLRATRTIRGSRIGVGFETLDRELFDPERVYPLLETLGATWARVQTGWCRCEPEAGAYDFAWLDAVVDALRARGIQPWFNLGFGNRHYMPDAPHPSAVGCSPVACGQEAEQAWTRFVAAMAAHFCGRVRHWEIWNEPDTVNFWRPGKPDASAYVRLVALTTPHIRRAQPDAFIIGGASSRLCPSLVRDYLAAGLFDWVDAYSFHPYRMIPEWHYRDELAAVRSLLAQARRPIQLWQGENGCPAVTAGHNDEWLGLYNITQQVQAKWAARRILSDLTAGLDLTSYFHITDLCARPYVQADGRTRPPVMMGLVDGVTHQPRLSFRAIQTLCMLFDGDTRPLALPAKVGKSASQPLEAAKAPLVAAQTARFARRGEPLFAWWYPEDPQTPTPVLPVDLHAYVESSGALRHPVLIDPLCQTVHALQEADRSEDGRLVHFAGVPYADYPLIITDRTVL